MTFVSRARALCVVISTLAASATLASTSLAQNFAPVAVVNDQVITGYDVQQRALLKSITQGGDADAEAALDELINDTLRLQTAKRFGIDPSRQEVRAGFDEISRRNRRDPEQMRSGLLSRGITAEALNEQIKAEVAWRRLIIQRFGPRVEVTDSDVDEIAGATPNVTPGETEYLLAEMRFPIQPGGEAAARAAATQAIAQMSSGQRFTEIAQKISKGPTALTGGDLGWVSRSSLSPASVTVLSTLNVDRVSPPFVEGEDIVIYGLRATREAGGGNRTTYSLAQLVVGLAPNAPQAQADAALARATAVRAELQSCEDVASRASQYLPISGDLGELSLASLPGPVREAVSGLNKGDITAPVRSNDGFHVLVVCDKKSAEISDDQRRERVRNRLRTERLDRFSKSFLRELRREAIIERR